MKRFILLVILGLLSGPAWAENWADNADYANDKGFAKSRALCDSLRKVDLPPVDRLDRRKEGGMANCSSEALYYGIGIPADPQAAFRCAELEYADMMFGGDRILATIYANGKGAPRDLDKAIALACRTGWAPAEFNGRVRDLDELRRSGARDTEFHWCDNATSGYLTGYCVDQDRRMAEAARQAELAGIEAGFTGTSKARLIEVMAARDTFAKLRSEEVAHSGTMSAADQVAAENDVRAEFMDDLRSLVVKAHLWTQMQDDVRADAELNKVYKRVMARDYCQWMECDKASRIRQAQRSWLKYRDAWMAFAASAGGKRLAQAALNLQTRHRIAQLKDILGED